MTKIEKKFFSKKYLYFMKVLKIKNSIFSQLSIFNL